MAKKQSDDFRAQQEQAEKNHQTFRAAMEKQYGSFVEPGSRQALEDETVPAEK